MAIYSPISYIQSKTCILGTHSLVIHGHSGNIFIQQHHGLLTRNGKRVLDVIICKHVVYRFPNISFLLFAYSSSLNLFQGGIKQTIVFVDIANRCDKEHHQQRLSCELNLLFVFLQNVTEKI